MFLGILRTVAKICIRIKANIQFHMKVNIWFFNLSENF